MGTHADTYAAVFCCLTLASMALGCGAQHVGAQSEAPRAAAVPLRSATVSAPPILSCRGHGVCREDTILSAARSEALDEATEDCSRRGGRSSPTACPRAASLASCSLATESGSTTVFTYGDADDAARAELLSEMSERCDDFGGSFTLATK